MLGVMFNTLRFTAVLIFTLHVLTGVDHASDCIS